MQNEDYRAAFRVVGRVQGVGFRWFVMSEALRLGLRGWVRNAHDGAVEVEASGSPTAIAVLRARLEQGPPAARVRQVIDEPPSTEPLPDDFEVAR